MQYQINRLMIAVQMHRVLILAGSLLISMLYNPVAAQVTAPIKFTIQAENCTQRQGGVYNPPVDHNPRYAITELGAGDWLRFDSINFYNGEFTSVTISYHASYYTTGTIRFRLDSPTGTIFGSLTNIPETRSMINDPPFQHSGTLSAVTGIHTVYVTFEGPATFCDLDWIRFSGQMTVNPANAKTFYVAADGDDNLNSGVTLQSPYRTIQKAASQMTPGSTCYIRGGVYRETVRPVFTGISGAPLTFEAYNNETVYISGADSVTGWTLHNGNIYKAQLGWSLGRYDNQILVDGQMAWEARTPNVDESYVPHPWLSWCGNGIGTYSWKAWQDSIEPIAIPSTVCFGGSSTGNGTFQFDVHNDPAPNQLPAQLFTNTTDKFAGGLISVRNNWWESNGYVTASRISGGDLLVDGRRTGGMGTDQGGNGWVSHVLSILDEPNEFHFDSASSTVYLWVRGGGSPSAHLVEAKRRVLGFDLSGKSYVTLKNLRFHAASTTLADAEYCTIDGCHYKYISHYDVFDWPYVGAGYFNSPFDPSDGRTGVFVGGQHNTVQNSTLNTSAGSGIILSGSYNTVSNCRIRACDYAVTYQAGILVVKRIVLDPNEGKGHHITGNTIDFSGRANIQIAQAYSPSTENNPDRLIIENNDLSVSCYTTKETGAIAGQSAARVEVRNNIFRDIGHLESFGIVMEYDFNGRHWIVHHNLFYKGQAIIPWRTGGNYTFDWNDTQAKCFNNTLVDSCEPLHRAREMDFPGYFKNNLYALSDTARWKFTDPQRRDYTLRDGSPAIDAGEIIPGYVEAGGFTGTAPDLGAFERGKARWTAGSSVAFPTWDYPKASSLDGSRFGRNATPAFAPRLRVQPSKLVVVSVPGLAGTLEIYTAAGRMLRAIHLDVTGNTSVDTERLTSGVFMVRCASGNQHSVWKVTMR
jgi:hypothetical protein